jgi:GxxExxY protein
MEINEITEIVIGCAIKVHRTLGAGLLESVYQAALAYEMLVSGLSFEKGKSLPVKYEKIKLDVGFRCDFFVENSVIVECKSVSALAPIDEAQLLNYLKITNTQVGLLINFNVIKLTDGLKRIVNNFKEK